MKRLLLFPFSGTITIDVPGGQVTTLNFSGVHSCVISLIVSLFCVCVCVSVYKCVYVPVVPQCPSLKERHLTQITLAMAKDHSLSINSGLSDCVVAGKGMSEFVHYRQTGSLQNSKLPSLFELLYNYENNCYRG